MTAPPQKSESPGATGQFAGNQNADEPILSQIRPDAKAFSAAQVAFALLGHGLTQTARADDGRVTWHVSRWGQSRAFGRWNDVLAFLTQAGGAP